MFYRDLDAHLLAPKRFVTLAHLNQVVSADYPTLTEVTGLTTADLSKIIRDLEERGIVEVSKERRNRYGHTLVRLSDEGRKRFLKLLAMVTKAAEG